MERPVKEVSIGDGVLYFKPAVTVAFYEQLISAIGVIKALPKIPFDTIVTKVTSTTIYVAEPMVLCSAGESIFKVIDFEQSS